MLAPRASVSPSHTRRRPRTATTPCTSRWGERDRWRWSGRACVVAGPAHARSREQPGRGRWRPPRAPSQVLGPVSDRSLASQVRGAVPSQSPSRCARHRFIFLRRCVRPRAHPRLGAPPRAGIVPRAVQFSAAGRSAPLPPPPRPGAASGCAPKVLPPFDQGLPLDHHLVPPPTSQTSRAASLREPPCAADRGEGARSLQRREIGGVQGATR